MLVKDVRDIDDDIYMARARLLEVDHNDDLDVSGFRDDGTEYMGWCNAVNGRRIEYPTPFEAVTSPRPDCPPDIGYMSFGVNVDGRATEIGSCNNRNLPEEEDDRLKKPLLGQFQNVDLVHSCVAQTRRSGLKRIATLKVIVAFAYKLHQVALMLPRDTKLMRLLRERAAALAKQYDTHHHAPVITAANVACEASVMCIAMTAQEWDYIIATSVAFAMIPSVGECVAAETLMGKEVNALIHKEGLFAAKGMRVMKRVDSLPKWIPFNKVVRTLYIKQGN